MKTFWTALAGLLILTGCGSRKPAAEQPEKAVEMQEVQLTDAQLQSAGIQTGTADSAVLESELRVNGLVDVPPQNMVSVSFPLGGYLQSTHLLPGMHVRKGEVLGTMVDPALIQLQQDYLVGQARLTYLQQEYDRQKLLRENQVNADKVFQQAQADLRSQQALVKGNAEKLRLIGLDPEKLTGETITRSVAIHSPIDGFVSRVNVNIGKYVNPADVLFELINPGDLHATFTVYEKDLPRISPGLPVRVRFVNDPATTYDCQVLLVTRNVDVNGSALVHCHFETPPRNLLPGMYLSGVISLQRIRALCVPEEAVVRYGGNQYVVATQDGRRFSLVQVQTGVTQDGKTELINGDSLKAGRIVVKNAYAVLGKLKNTGEGEE